MFHIIEEKATMAWWRHTSGSIFTMMWAGMFSNENCAFLQLKVSDT